MPSADHRRHTCATRAHRAALTAMSAWLLVACATETPPESVKNPETVAKELIAGYLDLPVTDITLVSLDAQEFNDSSLGCPEPGMSYLQALTPGHRVVVEADGRRFDVRVSSEYGRICRRNSLNKPGRKPAGVSMPGQALLTM